MILKATRVYGTCMQWRQRGVMFLGKSGVGKSDLALRMIDQGGHLVADDQCLLSYEDELQKNIVVNAPDVLQGLLEVRGVGICSVPYVSNQRLHMIVDLVSCRGDIPRIQEPRESQFLNLFFPLWKAYSFDFSVIKKIDFMLNSSL